MLDTYKQRIASLELIPSTGGCFEVKAGDELLYSKLDTGIFPGDDEMIAAVGKRIKETSHAH